jgi:hypothetical protein
VIVFSYKVSRLKVSLVTEEGETMSIKESHGKDWALPTVPRRSSEAMAANPSPVSSAPDDMETTMLSIWGYRRTRLQLKAMALILGDQEAKDPAAAAGLEHRIIIFIAGYSGERRLMVLNYYVWTLKSITYIHTVHIVSSLYIVIFISSYSSQDTVESTDNKKKKMGGLRLAESKEQEAPEAVNTLSSNG